MKDVSIHFSIKGQELSVIEQKFHDWSKTTEIFNEDQVQLRTHCCQLPRQIVEHKGFDLGITEFMESLTDGNDVNWFYSGTTMDMSRVNMLETIKRLGGKSIFIGDIKEGVEVEYKLAQAAGIECILIP